MNAVSRIREHRRTGNTPVVCGRWCHLELGGKKRSYWQGAIWMKIWRSWENNACRHLRKEHSRQRESIQVVPQILVLPLFSPLLAFKNLFPFISQLPLLNGRRRGLWFWYLLQKDSPWRREWQPTPVFLPEESPGRRSLLESMGSQRVGHDWATKHAHTQRKTEKEQDLKVLQTPPTGLIIASASSTLKGSSITNLHMLTKVSTGILAAPSTVLLGGRELRFILDF